MFFKGKACCTVLKVSDLNKPLYSFVLLSEMAVLNQQGNPLEAVAKELAVNIQNVICISIEEKLH